jgi:hypothetical protein
MDPPANVTDEFSRRVNSLTSWTAPAARSVDGAFERITSVEVLNRVEWTKAVSHAALATAIQDAGACLQHSLKKAPASSSLSHDLSLLRSGGYLGFGPGRL